MTTWSSTQHLEDATTSWRMTPPPQRLQPSNNTKLRGNWWTGSRRSVKEGCVPTVMPVSASSDQDICGKNVRSKAGWSSIELPRTVASHVSIELANAGRKSTQPWFRVCQPVNSLIPTTSSAVRRSAGRGSWSQTASMSDTSTERPFLRNLPTASMRQAQWPESGTCSCATPMLLATSAAPWSKHTTWTSGCTCPGRNFHQFEKSWCMSIWPAFPMVWYGGTLSGAGASK
mmetsp:Transcript_77955/g.220470  ORF Transcript_77955/g.220470 Transcript_77955/m.220470 type:complete len:230 (-) Transcript_77955:198-887(-)